MLQPTLRRKARGSKRQPLSCLPCRHHKLRCDRQLPCSTCVRYNREDLCHENPAPNGARVSQAPTPPLTTFDASQHSSDGRTVSAESYVAPIQQHTRGQDETISTGTRKVPRTINGLSFIAAAEELKNQRTSLDTSVTIQSFPEYNISQFGLDARSPKAFQSSIWSLFDFASSKLFWNDQLTRTLPTRTQCDILINYFIEHINWIFQSVHVPSFRRDYAELWDTDVEDVDPIWLSLVLSIISLSALYIPFEIIELVGIPRSQIRELAQTWHFASQQALQVGEYESKPRLLQLQTFTVTQLYWYATNNIELINSRLGQAIRHAQAINLDKDTAASTCLEDELRHRIWWELADADTFQSICLNRAPLIRIHSNDVPIPLNSNDIDITQDSVRSRPIDEPTELSLNVFRARLFKLLNNQLCSSNGTYLQNFNNVRSLDKELVEMMDNLPWYFQTNGQSLPAGYEFVKWQHHILRTCVSTQRIRMYKPFLASRISESWKSCAEAAKDALAVYREIRLESSPAYRQKFLPQAYQIFSVAVTLAALLLVERSQPFPDALEWLQNLASDLQEVEKQGCTAPVALHGRTVLLNMLSYYEHRRPYTPRDAENLVSDISIILGGEQPTRAYLNRAPVGQATDDQQDGTTSEPRQLPLTSTEDYSGEYVPVNEETNARDTPIDMSSAIFGYQTFDTNIPLDLLNWDMTGFLTDALQSGI